MPSKPSKNPFWIVAATAVVTMGLGARGPAAQTPQATPKPQATARPQATPTPPAAPDVSPADAVVLKAFIDRVNQYVALHKKLEDSLPKLPQEATAQQIDQNQRALAARIQAARKTAQRGELFTPEMTAYVKKVMAQFFGGPDGQKLRSSVMDENVKELPMTVNQRFPDAIPVSTMPPAILKALPTLPEQMQYRFVASQFVLLDSHSHLVADFIPAALPAKTIK